MEVERSATSKPFLTVELCEARENKPHRVGERDVYVYACTFKAKQSHAQLYDGYHG